MKTWLKFKNHLQPLINISNDIKGLRIGVPKEFFGEGLDKEVRLAIENAILEYKNLGASIVDVSVPSVDYALAVYYILMPAEVSSNLARFDGIRYGLSTLKDKYKNDNKESLENIYLDSRTEGFGDEAKRRIMLGSYVLSAGYYDAYYKKALKVRTIIKNDFDRVFKDVDLLITPVSPSTAFKFGEKVDDPLAMYLSDVMTVPINPAGLPAISIPAGFNNGLPIGLQLIGPMWSEEMLLNAANIFQKNTDFHKQKPKIN